MTLPAVQALRFHEVEVADPTSEEGEVLHELLVPLIGRSAPSSGVISPPSPGTVPVNPETFKARREVFQRLVEFFLKEAKEPSTDLVEVINWYEEGGARGGD